jgi:hypothetical protein
MSDQWYNNKELFEMINELKIELSNVTKELATTTKLIKGYNGLRENQNEFDDRLTKIETCFENKKENKKDYQWLIGFAFGVLVFLITKFL